MSQSVAKLMSQVSFAGGFVQSRHKAADYRYFVDALRTAQMEGVSRLEDLPQRVQMFVREYEEFRQIQDSQKSSLPSARAFLE